MAYLVDTNLLLRSSQPTSPLFQLANDAVAALLNRGEAVHIVPLKRLLPLLPEDPGIYPAWEQIVFTVGVQGKQVHDARLVAAMHVQGVSHILTFNIGDFVRYQKAGPGITVIHPGSV